MKLFFMNIEYQLYVLHLIEWTCNNKGFINDIFDNNSARICNTEKISLHVNKMVWFWLIVFSKKTIEVGGD